MQSQIAPDQTDYAFDRRRGKIETINSTQKNDVKSVHLEVNGVNVFHNEEYEGFTISWSSDIGFGEYQYIREQKMLLSHGMEILNAWI